MIVLDKIRRFSLFIIAMLFTIFCFAQHECKILKYSTSIQVKTGKLIEKKSFLIEIDNKESNWIADVSIPFNANEKLEILDASILDSKGNVVRKLKKKEITTRSDISDEAFFEDDLVSEFKLKWGEYPYQIKYSFERTTSDFLYIAKWSPVYDTDIQTDSASLQVEIPRDFKARIDASSSLKENIDTLDESYVYKWLATDIPPFKKETFSPSYLEILPQVTIVPIDFTYGLKGSFASWQCYGAWQDNMNKGLDQLPLSAQWQVSRLIEGIDDPKKKISVLYHYMQDNTRYINVTIDRGGLKPYPASYVSEKKYGDCKALTIYMKALLKVAGIQSFYTKIYAGKNPVPINPNMPSQQFNHIILMVPLEKDTVWLENTANFFPSNYLGIFTQNRWGLVVNGEQSKLIKTPKLSMENDKAMNTYQFNLNRDGIGKAIVKLRLNGASYENCKYAQHNLDRESQKDYLENILSMRNFQIENWKFNQPDLDKPFLTTDLKLDVKNQIRFIGGMLVLQPVLLKMPALGKPDSRKTPVRINYPINQQDSIKYNIPEIETFRIQLPAKIDVESKYGKFVEDFSMIDSTLIVNRQFQLYSGDYPLKDYPDFYNFINSIQKVQNQSAIILNPTQ